MRFGGHSYIRYQHSQIGSWHMHFRLKTHQLHAVVLYANGTDGTTLEVRIAVHRGFFPVYINLTRSGKGVTERRCSNSCLW